jgi:hypothetical protein
MMHRSVFSAGTYLQPWCDALCVEGVQAGQVCEVVTSSIARLANHTGVTAAAEDSSAASRQGGGMCQQEGVA